MRIRLALPQSLRTLTLLFVLTFAVAIILTGVTSYLATRQTVAALVDQRLDTISDDMVDDDPGALENIRERVAEAADRRETADLGLILRGKGGKLLFANVSLARRLPIGFSSLDHTAGIKGLTHGRALVRDLGGGASLTTIGETEPIDNYNAARLNIYLLGYGSIVVIVLGGVAAFGIAIGRRITALSQTADAIINGDLTRRVPDRGSNGEFDRQARVFNHMLDRITTLMHEISSVTNDIAHDLRTPLARLRAQLVALQPGAADQATRSGLAAAIAQNDEILAMFTAMLRIGEIEAGNRRAGFARVDLADLLADVTEMLTPVAVDAQHELSIGTHPPIAIAGDRQLLIQMIVNLVENAIRHTPPETRINVSARSTNDAVEIRVADNGPGIPSDQFALALRRFGRIDKARHGGGHGLGLALAEAVARLHHGELSLSSADPGLIVTVSLPTR